VSNGRTADHCVPASGLCQQRVPAVAVADAIGLDPHLVVVAAAERFGTSLFGAVHHNADVIAGPPSAAGTRQRGPVTEMVEVVLVVAG
jgi:hypothetical protein